MNRDNMRKVYLEIREFVRNMRKENLSAFAAGAAFFIFLSLVPILIVICTVIPYTPLTQENLLLLIMEITPDKVDGIVVEIVDDVYERSAGVLSLAALLTLWSAGKGILAVVRGLNAVNDVDEYRNYFMVRLVASFYTLVMLLIIIVSMVILVFGNMLVEMLVTRLSKLDELFSFLMNFRFLVIWIILTMIFSAFYAYLPNKKLKFRKQIPGASFAAVLWSIFSWGFSIYVNHGNFYNIYGSLSILIFFMMWMYFCIYIMFIGAYINKHMAMQEEG